MKNKSLILALLLVLYLSFSVFIYGCKTDENKINAYTLVLNYDDESRVLSGKERLEYINTSDNAFASLYFHLYPNAYRQDNQDKVVSKLNFDKTYPEGESFGEVIIANVEIKGQTANFEISEDGLLLKIDMFEDLYPDEKVKIDIDFSVKLAIANHRLGYGENTINFGNFYPIVCVYEDGVGFVKDGYYANGDPFYSECANYNIDLTFSNKYNCVCSGEIINEKRCDDLIEVNAKSQKMRDFCFVLSEKLQKTSKVVDEIEINYFGYNGDEKLNESLNISANAIKTFNKLFGKYPYKRINIVKSNFAYGGMEYPGLVLISDSIENQKDIDYVIVHELAHQWWYGVVGNDEFNHAWLDEGLTEFSTMLFFDENNDFGENYDELIRSAMQSYKLFEKVYKNIEGEVDGRMERSLNEFKTEPEYIQCTYTKGVLMFDSVMKSVGKKKLLKALQHYYKEYSFKVAKPEDLIECFCKICGQNLEGFIYSWLNGSVIIE